MTNSPNATWYSSPSAEAWECKREYPTPEAAIAGAVAEHGLAETAEFWVGRRFEVRIDAGRYAEALIDLAAEQAAEQVGIDEVGSWPGATDVQVKDLRARLQRLFHGWLADHALLPTFFGIADIRCINRQAPPTA